jgi:hypothetical protein
MAMSPIPVALVAVSIGLATPAFAQEWGDFASPEDRFSINFPGQPKVETITWVSEFGLKLPGRVYTAFRGPEKYVITVVDYSGAEKEYFATPKAPSFQGTGYWRIDIMASVQYAATKLYRYRPGAKVTYDAWHHIDRVAGQQVNLINPDKTVTFASIYLHDNRLYILEGTVPAGAPDPGLFTQSISFLDAGGKRVRYDDIYTNKLPPITIKQ